jgi:hypothetical protein
MYAWWALSGGIPLLVFYQAGYTIAGVETLEDLHGYLGKRRHAVRRDSSFGR